MKDVVDVTKGLFALSKETAKLEHDAFIQRQKVALAAEVKSVLDSWVRFEQQEKESEQAELAKTVIERVTKSLTDAKNQQDILNNAIAEVERKFLFTLTRRLSNIFYFRTCQGQGYLKV